MSEFKSWVFSICIAVITVTLLSMFTIDEKMEKVIKYTIGLFLILVIASPVVGVLKDGISFDYNDIHITSNQQISDYNNGVCELYKTKVQATLSKKLQENGIKFDNLSVDINITEDNCISISRVVINTGKITQKMRNSILTDIKKEVGVVPQIIESLT